MNKVRVQLVKYDMTKTKNRNRKDLLVDGKSESAVITQLERIHKGEKVVTIHELIWDENQIKEVARLNRVDENPSYYGKVKFFDGEKGFGFIEPENEMDDVFFHATACPEGLPHDKDRVEFKVSKGPKGLTATQIKIIDFE
jgi:CspA family cold shock protein